MRQKVKTQGDMTASSPAHQEAMRKGDEHFRSWHLNVADRFKDKTTEEIRQELRQTAFPFAVCFENWLGDFNIGTGIRNANAFNAQEVYYIGNKKWDRRSAVGTYNYVDLKFLASVDELIALKDKYVIVGIDNVPGSVSLSTYRWRPNTLMVFGEEGVGLTPAMQSFCTDIVEIPMFGSVRSLNCGVASGIVMHSFVQQISLHL
jgi:tRNA G18 (ribose-2'-O)-methylase SpoU